MVGTSGMGETGKISAVLKDPRVEAAQDIFDRHDRAANRAQHTFKRFSLIFILATAVASLTAALILFGSSAGEGTTDPIARFLGTPNTRNMLFIVEVAALAIAAFAAHIQETRQHSARWTRERRAAEACRIEIFDTILTVAAEHDAKMQLAAFDHFISKQLDGQIAYFSASEARHDNRSSRFAMIGAAAATIVAIAGISGLSDAWLPLAAMAGVIAPIFLTALNSWRDTGNDEEKAGRYGEVWTALRRLKGQTGLVRADFEAGNSAALHTFAQQVHDVLSAEIMGWNSSAGSQDA
ncbi:MAG: DUF4231 domain-containing protein [Pseudomonadota bacterium]